MGNQTAVEWFEEQSWELHKKLRRESISIDYFGSKYEEVRNKAKAMEKQQIIDARVDGDENHTFNSMMREEYANDYYKETYGK